MKRHCLASFGSPGWPDAETHPRLCVSGVGRSRGGELQESVGCSTRFSSQDLIFQSFLLWHAMGFVKKKKDVPICWQLKMIFSIIIDCFLGCIVRQTYVNSYVHFISGTAGLGCLSHELQAAGKYGALDPLLNTDSRPVFFAECVSFTSHIVRSTVILDVVACPQSRQLAASCSEALEDSETPKLNCLQITAEHAGSLH